MVEIFEKKGKFGVRDSAGEVVVPCEYDSVSFKCVGKEGYKYKEVYEVIRDGKLGWFDLDGNEILPCQYEAIENFGTSCLLIENKKCGLISFSNEIVIPCEYDAILSEQGLVMKDNKLGLHSKHAHIPCEYEDVEEIRYGYCKVKRDKKWGLADRNGKIVIQMQYDKISYHTIPGGFGAYGGLFLEKDGKFVARSLDGKVVLKEKFDNFFSVYDAFIKETYQVYKDKFANDYLESVFGSHV